MALSSSWHYDWNAPTPVTPDCGSYPHYYHSRVDKTSPNNIADYFSFLLSLGMFTPDTLMHPHTSYNGLDGTDRKVLETTGPLKTLYRWKVIDFAYANEDERVRAKRAKEFVPQNVLPLGIEVYKERIFMSFPKWKGGVPITLGYITTDATAESPLIKPYPNWTIQKTGNCNGFTSVYRMQADVCGRLWVLDAGQIDVAIDPKQVCPPTIFIFDLKDDALLTRYELPPDFVKQDSLYSNIVVDIQKDDCANAHAYVTDVWRFGLVVFSLKKGRGWRLSDHLFYPDPLAAAYELNGLEWEWTDGVFSMALGPYDERKEDRLLYYHPMSSFREFYSFCSIVQNETGWMDARDAFRVLGESRGKSGQASTSAMDRNGVLFFNLVTRSSIGCWDSRKPYKRTNLGVLASDNETLVFPNDLKIDNEKRQSLWILTNRLPFFIYKSLDFNDYNFRVMTTHVDEAIAGGICDPDYSCSDSYDHDYEDCA